MTGANALFTPLAGRRHFTSHLRANMLRIGRISLRASPARTAPDLPVKGTPTRAKVLVALVVLVEASTEQLEAIIDFR